MKQQQPQQQQQTNFQGPQMHLKDIMLKDYETISFVDNLQSSTFGEIQVFRMHPYVKYLGCKNVPLTQQVNVQQKMQQRHPNIFYMPKIEQTNNNQMKVYFEYKYPTVAQHISQRLEKKYLYPEYELWIFLKQMINAMKYLQENNTWHGDIDAHNIFYDDEYLMYRIYDNFFLNNPYEGFKKMSQGTVSYISPELIQTLKMKEQLHTGYNFYKADVFSLGMVLLEFGSFNSSSKCYDLKNFQLDFDRINSHIHTFAKRYSPILVSLLQRLLEVDYRKRLDWIDLNTLLSEESINQCIKTSVQQNIQWIKQQEGLRKEFQVTQQQVLSKEVTMQTVLPKKSYQIQEQSQLQNQYLVDSRGNTPKSKQSQSQLQVNHQSRQSLTPQSQSNQAQASNYQTQQVQQEQYFTNQRVQNQVHSQSQITVQGSNSMVQQQQNPQQNNLLQQSQIQVFNQPQNMNQQQNMQASQQIQYPKQKQPNQVPQQQGQVQNPNPIPQQQQQYPQNHQQYQQQVQNQVQSPQQAKNQVQQVQQPQQQPMQTHQSQQLQQKQPQTPQQPQQQVQSPQQPQNKQAPQQVNQNQYQQMAQSITMQQQDQKQREQIQFLQNQLRQENLQKSQFIGGPKSPQKENGKQQVVFQNLQSQLRENALKQSQNLQPYKQNEQQQGQQFQSSDKKQQYVFEGMNKSMSKNVLDSQFKKFMSSSQMLDRENLQNHLKESRQNTMYSSQIFAPNQAQKQQNVPSQYQQPQQQENRPQTRGLGLMNDLATKAKNLQMNPNLLNNIQQGQRQQQQNYGMTMQPFQQQQQNIPQFQQQQGQQYPQQGQQPIQDQKMNFQKDMNQTLQMLNKKIQDTLAMSSQTINANRRASILPNQMAPKQQLR